MTLEERKTKAGKEILVLLELYQEEEEQITTALKQSGKFTPGLDGNSEDYAPIRRKFNQKLAEVLVKYDLPPGTKLKL